MHDTFGLVLKCVLALLAGLCFMRARESESETEPAAALLTSANQIMIWEGLQGSKASNKRFSFVGPDMTYSWTFAWWRVGGHGKPNEAPQRC